LQFSRRGLKCPVLYFHCTGVVEPEVSMRRLPGASKNIEIATASSTRTRSPIAELRILTERGSGHVVTRLWISLMGMSFWTDSTSGLDGRRHGAALPRAQREHHRDDRLTLSHNSGGHARRRPRRGALEDRDDSGQAIAPSSTATPRVQRMYSPPLINASVYSTCTTEDRGKGCRVHPVARR
jgi:hypothetical protein